MANAGKIILPYGDMNETPSTGKVAFYAKNKTELYYRDDDGVDHLITASGTGGVTDHGDLTGLSDDDHLQYHTDARGDARYYTEIEIDTTLSGYSQIGHTHIESNITNLDKYTQVEVNTISGVLQTQIDNITVSGATTFIDLADTPNVYADGRNYLLRATTSGIEYHFLGHNNHLVCVSADRGTSDGDGSTIFPVSSIDEAITHIESIAVSGTNYVINLLPGVYEVDSLNINNYNVVSIVGECSEATIIKPVSNTPNTFITIPYTTSLKSITIDATDYPSLATASGSIGIDVRDDSYNEVVFSDVYIRGFGTNLNTDAKSNIYLFNCDFRYSNVGIKAAAGAMIDADILFVDECYDKHIHALGGAEVYLANTEICSMDTLSGTGLYVEGADTNVEIFSGTNIWSCDKDIVVKDTATVRVDNCILEESESRPTIEQKDTSTLIIINSRAPLDNESFVVEDSTSVYVNAYDLDEQITSIGNRSGQDQSLINIINGSTERPNLGYIHDSCGTYRSLGWSIPTDGEDAAFYTQANNGNARLCCHSIGESAWDKKAEVVLMSDQSTVKRGWFIRKESGATPRLLLEYIDGTRALYANYDGSITLCSGVSVDKILDEDDFASNDASALSTQQAIKSFIDTVSGSIDNNILYADGSKELIADWDVGDYSITADGFRKDNMEIELSPYSNSTGILSGGDLSINSSNPYMIDVTSGTALYVDVTDSSFPIVEKLSWPSQSISGSLDGSFYKWLGVYRSSSKTGDLVIGTNFSHLERRTTAVLGKYWSTISGSDQITNVANYTTTGYGSAKTLEDFIDAYGVLNIEGNRYSASLITPMTLARTAGQAFRRGANRSAQPTSPNIYESSADDSISSYYYQISNSYDYTVKNVIDPNYYDLNGVLLPVPTGKWTVQRLYYFPVSNVTVIYWGQHYYDSDTQAYDGVSKDTFDSLPNAIEGAVLRGYLIVKQGATDLTNSNQAVIYTTYGRDGILPGFSDHGALGGLDDDDHLQYHTDARGDARYYTQNQVDTLSGTLSQSENIDYTNTNWSLTDVGTALDNLTDYVENTHGTGRISPIETTISGFLQSTLYINAGEGYINYDGLHKKVTWPYEEIDVSGYVTGIHYVYIDYNGDSHITTTYPGTSANILLGSFYFTGSDVIGLTQTCGCVLENFFNRIIDYMFNLGVFLTSDSGLIQVASGVDNTRITSPVCSAQYGTSIIDLPERGSDDAVIGNFLAIFTYNDGVMNSCDYFNSSVGWNGSLPINRWNNTTSYSGTLLSSGTCTFTQYSDTVSVSGTTGDMEIGDFIWYGGDACDYQTPIIDITGNTITLDAIYMGSGGTGHARIEKSLPLIPDGKWAKHLIGRTLDGNMQFIFSQNYFDSEEDANNAGCPVIPSIIEQGGIKMAYVVCSGTETDISNCLIDIRPLPFHDREGGSQTGGIATDHGDLTGLADDDHRQYILSNGSRNFVSKVKYEFHPSFSTDTDIVDKKYVDDHQFDHGGLAGLSDDDHTQYFNQARGDARYFTQEAAAVISGTLQTQIDGKSDTGHTHTESDVTNLDKYTQAEVTTISGNIVDQIPSNFDDRYYTETELDNGQLDNRYYTEAEIDDTLSSGTSVKLQDEGGDVTNTPHSRLNFTGVGVTVSDAGSGVATINIPAASGGIIVKDEGTTVSGGPHNTVDFIGQMVTATDAGGGEVTVDIPYPTFGTYYGWGGDTSAQSTNSTSWVQAVRVNVPSIPDSYFRVGWYFEWRRNTASNDFKAQVQIDDTETIMSMNEESKDVNSWHPASGFAILDLSTGTHTIDVDFAGETTGNTSYIRNIRIEYWRVS